MLQRHGMRVHRPSLQLMYARRGHRHEGVDLVTDLWSIQLGDRIHSFVKDGTDATALAQSDSKQLVDSADAVLRQVQKKLLVEPKPPVQHLQCSGNIEDGQTQQLAVQSEGITSVLQLLVRQVEVIELGSWIVHPCPLQDVC